MRIAIPTVDGRLSEHFGHCDRFTLFDVDFARGVVVAREDVESPPHQPGLLPPWLAERGANMIIARGMGQRAHGLFAKHRIEVVVGAPQEAPEKLVGDFLAGTLRGGQNICNH